MTFTDNYIKMASKATKVQEEWERTVGDWYTTHMERSEGNPPSLIDAGWFQYEIDELFTPEKLKKCTRHWIWLPLQHQLQGMVYVGPNMSRFHSYRDLAICFGVQMQDGGPNWSLEELWLAFIMKERWNKCWIDGEWKEHTDETG